MGECGCSHIQWRWKIIDKNGDAWLFGIYPSCDYCDAPVGIDIWKIKKVDWHLWDVESIPEFEISEYGTTFINVLSTTSVRNCMKKAILGFHPEDGVIDDIDADVLSKEAFRDLREAVFGTKDGEG